MPRPLRATLLLPVLVGCSELHELQRADGGVDAPPADVPSAAPRPLEPLSTTTVSSQRPTLRWAPSPAGGATRVELCRDRACAHMVDSATVTGARWRRDATLAPGVYFWRLSSAAGARSATWQFAVGARDAPVDGSRAATLDLNGDGLADLVVSATEGRVYLYLGDRAGPDARPTATLPGLGGPTPSPMNLAAAGDVNGDGYGDLVVGEPWAPGGRYEGRAYVFHGGAGGVGAGPATTLVGRDGANAAFGAVAGAGDVNSDGYADVFVGAAGTVRSLGQPTAQGRGYIYFGGPAGLATEPGIRLVSTEFGHFGGAFAAGDFNGDGRVDLAVSAPFTGNWAGTTYVYLQPAEGFGAAPAPTVALHGTGGDVEQFGAPLTTGDFNGDGFVDLVIGAIRGRDLAGTYNAGRLYLYRWSASGMREAGVVYGTAGAAAQLGVAPAQAADLDGDGYDDLAVGAWGVARSEGRVYVYRGGAEGIRDRAAPDMTLAGPDGPGGEFGIAVSLGDVNGDLLADIHVGGGHVGGTGRAYLYLGRDGGVPAATPSVTFTSPAGPGGLFGMVVR